MMMMKSGKINCSKDTEKEDKKFEKIPNPTSLEIVFKERSRKARVEFKDRLK